MLERTQIMLDSEIKRDLRVISELDNKSMSGLIREILSDRVTKKKKEFYGRRPQDARNVLRDMAKHAVKGPGNDEYDKYAYGL